jgi:hypothetical protein
MIMIAPEIYDQPRTASVGRATRAVAIVSKGVDHV